MTALIVLLLVATPALSAGQVAGGSAVPASAVHDIKEILGTWEGTSTCTDRVAAPACQDEVAVYEISAAAAQGAAAWKAYKIVAGQKVLMGELELRYSDTDHCWRADFSSPRVASIWCLSVKGAQMTGTAWLMPGKQVIRAVSARKK